MAEGLDAVWASGLSSQASSALSSSSSQHTGPGTQQWALLGVFGALCVAVLAVFVLKLVRQHEVKGELLVLFVGWVLRCTALLWDLSTGVLSNAAGLFFFAACCIALANLLRTFHCQRDCPGSVYRSVKMVLVGYNVFFVVVEVCMTVAFLAAPRAQAAATTALLESVLSALFGVSFLFIAITFGVVFVMLRDAWPYLRAVVPLYVVLVLCLLFRAVVNLLSAVLPSNEWYSVTANGVLSSVFSEAVPGLTLVFIVLLTRPPWDGEYLRLFDSDTRTEAQAASSSDYGSTQSRSSSTADDAGAADVAVLERVFAETGGVTVVPRARVRVVDVAGSGAAATVYRATWDGATVALKVFRTGARDLTRRQLQCVAREVRALAALRHPSVAAVLGVTWTAEGQLGLVREYAELGTLRGVLASMHRDMQWSLRLRMALDVARGMAYLHRANVLHRALRSTNVLVTKVLRCRVADVGVVGLAAPDTETTDADAAALAALAPEVLRTHHYAPASDVYSFGALLAEIAAGCPPLADCTLPAPEMRAALEAGRLAIRPAPAWPPAVADIVRECTRAQPSERPSFLTLEHRLEALRGAVGNLQDSPLSSLP